MKPTFIALLALCLSLVGCGKKDPKLRSEKVITPGEAANKLFVEATLQMSKAVSKDDKNDIDGAVTDYKQVVANVRKIVNDYPESDMAVKLVSGEALFTGKSMGQIEERVKELERRAEEQRKTEEQRRAEAIAMDQKLQELLAQERIAAAEAKDERDRLRKAYDLIKDPIEKRIRVAVGKPTGELTEVDWGKVTSLNFNDNKLTKLPESLEKLTQLTELNLNNNQLTDVKGLEKLTQLNKLYLNNNDDLTKTQITELQKALPKCTIRHNATK